MMSFVVHTPQYKPSERKLLLVGYAMLRSEDFTEITSVRWTECPGGGGRRLTANVQWEGSKGDYDDYHFANDTDAGTVADAVREVLGNPFRPVTLPVGEECKKCRGKGTVPAGAGGAVVGRPDRVACEACHGTGHGPSPVLTPLVLSLAEAAYQERHPSGTLDPDRLMVLSDALIDAGLLEWVGCEVCQGAMTVRTQSSHGHSVDPCKACSRTGRQPHPMLAHLRSPGPHYRGCFAIDLLTGRM
jgi:hypothetical protein